MNTEILEKTVSSRLTRRKVVTTGTKLAYAAPLVAASFKLSSLGAAAQVDTCDDLSPKNVNGVQLTCKTDASGFGCDVRESTTDGDNESPPAGSAQVEVDEANGTAFCRCNNQSGCRITQPDGSTITFARNANVTVCHPVPLPDFCGGVAPVSPV